MRRCAFEDALIAEPRQVEGLVAAVQQQLTQAATHCRRLHQPVPRKAEGNVKVLQSPDPRPQDGVVVEAVLIVMTGPGAGHLERLECRHALRTASTTTPSW